VCGEPFCSITIPRACPPFEQPARVTGAHHHPFSQIVVAIKRGGGAIRACNCRQLTLTIDPPQHGVHEFAGTDTVASLCKLHGLRDRGVRRHTSHLQQLIRAQSQQIAEVRIETCETAGDARCKD
jgi:hypothetical protein